MKIGITLKDFYKDFLKEVAILNGTSPTTICSLIVENYLSFNKEKGRLPLFSQRISVIYADKKKKIIEPETDAPVGKRMSRKEMLAILNDVPEDDSGSYEFESED